MIATAVETAPETGPAKSQGYYLSEWLFYVPYILSVILYFRFIDSSGRVVAPALVPAGAFAGAGILAMLRRRVAINRDVCIFTTAWLFVSLCTLLWSNVDNFYASRKILLPILCMSTGFFRYRITRLGMATFIVCLTIVAIVFTTQSADVYSEGFTSTDSPYESIIGVSFGVLTVWLVAHRAFPLTVPAYAACILFFKRNAILVAGLISIAGMYLTRIRFETSLRYLRWGVATAMILLPLIAFYLVDIYEFIAENTGFALGGESLSSGRSLIYAAIINDISHSSLVENFFGHGAGAVEYLVSTTGLIQVNLGLAHNEYLSMIYDFGFFGYAILALFLLRCVRNTASGFVMLFVVASMSAENLFLVTFTCLTIFFVLSAEMKNSSLTA